MFDIWVGGKRQRLDPDKAIGKGGEADVYDLGNGKVLKVFKRPDHPDLQGQPEAQAAAVKRIAEHQQKLRAFPTGLPARVVAPEELALDAKGNVAGFTMRFLSGTEVLLRYTQQTFRQGIPASVVVQILKDMHMTVGAIHRAGVVIGDFNDLNVLVKDTEANFIDADSMQFGQYHCMVYTQRFVDPLLCDPNAKAPELVKPHNKESDWYAFAVMVMQTMLFVEPYGGTYKPKNATGQIPHTVRPLKRITVFNPDVRYPKPAIPYKVLPDDLLQFFLDTFEKDRRGVFPARLLEELRWTKCTSCGSDHARHVCPNCSTAAPEAVKARTVVRGQVEATRVFWTSGTILRADVHNGHVLWLYHENGAFKREGGVKVADGAIDPHIRYRLRQDSTIMAKGSMAVRLQSGTVKDKFDVDVLGQLPVLDTNDSHTYWTHGGVLYRDEKWGRERIGEVLAGQTMVWVGPKFGFGLYRAGQLTVTFIFNTEASGINDTVKTHPIRGKLIDATCVISDSRAWFLTSTQEGGKTVNRCSVIKEDGTLEASAEAEAGDGSWLSSIRGGCATRQAMLIPTDQGIIQVKADQGKISIVKEFPDTEPFVDSVSKLVVGSDGLYVVGSKEITRLVIK
jgi:hypothetical protein